MGAAASTLSALFGGKKLITGPGNQGKPVEKKSIQDDARSFYSKASAIKLLIKGEESRNAFRKFMEQQHPPEVEYLDYWITVEAIKKGGGESLRHKYMDLIQQYETKAETTKQSVAVTIAGATHNWKGSESLSDDELFKLMGRSQEDILGILTPNFEAFVASKHYAEYLQNQNKMEKNKSGNEKAVPGKPLPIFKRGPTVKQKKEEAKPAESKP
jgi:hypothetical protein